MASPKITGLMISIIIISIFAMTYANYLSVLSTNYGITDYDNSTLSNYNSYLANVTESTEELKEGINFKVDENEQDKLGEFLSGGLSLLKGMGSTFNLLGTMVQDVFRQLNIPIIGDLLMKGWLTIVLILISVGIFVSVLVKRERL